MLAPRADFHWQSERITLFRLACHAWAVKIVGEMSRYHLVRVGAMGQVGRFAAVDAVRYPRRSRVIVRTRRGLELGDVLCPPDDSDDGRIFADGDLVRGVTVQDELMQAR